MKIKRSMELRAEELTDFFSIYNAVQGEDSDVLNLARRLARFFEELPAFAPIPEQPVIRSPQATDLAAFFSAAKSPLESEKERGGLLNFWRITGLKYNEVRTAGALAGLWRHDFGGRVSLAFIECYLAKVVPNLNWQEELREGYSVFTEINPLGDMADRVDLVIETRRYLIGIEIKIRAGLGLRQLERYASALESRARHTQKSPLLIFLAPYVPVDLGVYLSSWKDIAAAARSATHYRREDQTFIHHIIASFGEYVSKH